MGFALVVLDVCCGAGGEYCALIPIRCPFADSALTFGSAFVDYIELR